MEQEKSMWKRFVKRYLIDALSGMALGLFATLIVGSIMKQIALGMGDNFLGNLFLSLGNVATVATGVGIGIGIAHTLQAPKLVIYASTVTGLVGAYAGNLGQLATVSKEGGAIFKYIPGDPVGAFIAVIIGIEVGRLIAGKAKLDIILTPIITILAGGLVGVVVGPYLSSGMKAIGSFIMWATELRPLTMGIVVSTIMGVILTLPISSAALSIMLQLSGLAAGAATVGCATQMVGFAVASYRENKFNGLLAQGLGTSMLQIPNIVKNPMIWIPPTLASAILGPLATVVFQMENNPSGAGMGTAGLVGPLMTWQTMIQNESGTILFIKIIVLHFVLPAILTLVISEFMRHMKWIKFGDMKLDA